MDHNFLELVWPIYKTEDCLIDEIENEDEQKVKGWNE